MKKDITEAELLAVYDSTLPKLYSQTFRWTRGSKSLTEDIVQETYLRALENWEKKGLPENPEAWLMKVSKNLAISHFRKAGTTMTEELPPELRSDEKSLVESERSRLLYRALANLRDSYSRLLQAFHLEGKSMKEIAAEEEISDRAVEGRLRRGRKRLKEILTLETSTEADKNE